MWCGMNELHDAWDIRMALIAHAEPEKLEARVFAAQFHWNMIQNQAKCSMALEDMGTVGGAVGGREGVRSASGGHVLFLPRM